MTGDHDDDDLRASFSSLRERDLAAVPELDLVLKRSARPKRARRAMAVPALAGVVVCAVALLAASAWLRSPSGPVEPEGVSLALPDWRTPTDTLLRGGDGPRPTPWADLPTAGLGHSSLHRSQERP